MTEDSVLLRVNPSNIDALTKWVMHLNIEVFIGPLLEPKHQKPYHVVRITCKNAGTLTMACLYGTPIIFFNSHEMTHG